MAKALGRSTMSTTTNNNKKATTKRFRWNTDGRDGPNDPYTSEQVLINWLSTSNHYKTYRESTSRGAKKCYKKAALLTKLQLCQQASDKIQRAGVRCPRTAQQVKWKIERLERQFREAQHYVRSEEGQRLLAEDPRFFPCRIRRKCPRYASLRRFMSDSIVSGDADDKKPVTVPDDLLGRIIEVPAGGASALDHDDVDGDDESEAASGSGESEDESNDDSNEYGDLDESGDDESGSDDDGPDEDTSHGNDDGASRLLWLEMMYYLYTEEEEDDQDDYDEMSDMSPYFFLRRLQREQNLRTALARFKATTRHRHHHLRRRCRRR